jgi:hypothetical protein
MTETNETRRARDGAGESGSLRGVLRAYLTLYVIFAVLAVLIGLIA